jgi:hypothetical protein
MICSLQLFINDFWSFTCLLLVKKVKLSLYFYPKNYRDVEMVGVIISLFFISALFFLWQFSRGEQIGRRIGLLVNIWGAVILFYLIMIVFL